jgi:hypothetical protein
MVPSGERGTPVAARRHARRRDRVRHQRDARTGRREDEPADRTDDVGEVGDETEGVPRVRQGGAGHAGFPVRQRALRVEQVRHHRRAGIGGLDGLRGGGVAVSDRDDHTGVHEPPHGLHAARHLRRHGDDAQRRGDGLVGQQLVQVGRLRRHHQGRLVHAVPDRGQEGALQVQAERPGDAGRGQRRRGGDHRVGLAQHGGHRRRDERRQEPGDAGGRQGLRDQPEGVRVHVGEVDAERAVDLDVHQPGGEQPGGQHLGRAGVAGADVDKAAAPDAHRDRAGHGPADECSWRCDYGVQIALHWSRPLDGTGTDRQRPVNPPPIMASFGHLLTKYSERGTRTPATSPAITTGRTMTHTGRETSEV